MRPVTIIINCSVEIELCTKNSWNVTGTILQENSLPSGEFQLKSKWVEIVDEKFKQVKYC